MSHLKDLLVLKVLSEKFSLKIYHQIDLINDESCIKKN